MNYFAYILKFLYRIKLWLILCPAIVALLVYLKMGQARPIFKATTTIYTGIVSGYDIESSGGSRQDWNIINNAMDNLINIIQSQSTLKNVSMRLYTQNMVHGEEEKDNNYLLASTYRGLMRYTPPEVKALVDRSSDSITLMNFRNYEKASHDNHIYGLFMWTHPHYSYKALSTIKVKRVGSSDMLEVAYENDDPGVVYNTLQLLTEEFVKQYKDLRFGETNNVIAYFESELARVGRTLQNMEDSLRDYNIEHKVINYDEQTKHIASLSRDYDLRTEEILLNLESSQRLRKTIESQLENLQELFQNNSRFLSKLREIGKLQAQISAAEAFGSGREQSIVGDDKSKLAFSSSPRNNIDALRAKLEQETRELRQITIAIANQQYTKEGVSATSMIAQWLDAVLLEEKSQAEMNVMKGRKKDIDDKYVVFSPVGSTLKRKNRAIGFSEQSYLSILQALNTARLRQKNLQMTSATLRVINPPAFPISAEPNKRKMMTYAAFACTFFFVLGFFVLLELLDRTLRDKIRTERITGGKVLGAFPGQGGLRDRRFIQVYREIASRQLGNAMLNYFHTGKPNILNILSTEPGDGKTTVVKDLADHYRQTGMKVRTISAGIDFNPEQKEYLLAKQFSDFIRTKAGETPFSEADVIMVEYPAFSTCPVPRELLQNASLNLLVAPANRTWKDTDQQLYETAVALCGQTPLCIGLNRAQRNVLESFTGLVPPMTLIRKLGYQISQFGFTGVK